MNSRKFLMNMDFRLSAFLMCYIAYGADQKLFTDVVEKGYLPKARAEGCDGEYEQLAFAFKKLIDPYIDRTLARKIMTRWMRDVKARPRPSPNR